MTRKAWLSAQQNRRTRRIAREKGLTCPDCGSSEPVPEEGKLGVHPDGGAEIQMRCEACEGETEMALVLTPEEVKALGLHSLGEPQQAPCRLPRPPPSAHSSGE